MKKSILLVVLIQLGFFYSLNAQTKKDDAVQLKFGIFLKKIVPDFKENKFYAEFYWWVRFKNDTTQSEYTNEEIINLQYVNGCETPNDAFVSEIQEERDLGNHQYYYTGYHQGSFFFLPNFSNYPFDEQEMKIELEHSIYLDEELHIIPDYSSFKKSGMPKEFYGISTDLLTNPSISLRIDQSSIKQGTCTYNSDFGDPDFPSKSKYSRLTFSVSLDRIVAPYITKFFIPLGIILFLVYFVFFIPADKLDMAAGLTVTSLLSAIAFQFTINSDLPEIGYLIYVDKVFYLTYILIVLAMGESLVTFYMDLSDNERKKNLAVKIDLYSRFLFPIIFIVFSFLFIQ